MILNAEVALRQAIRAALLLDKSLGARLNQGVYDEAPRHAVFPYVSFGDVVLRDWSTGSDRGLEHQFTLEIWSAEPGAIETLELADLIVDALARASVQPQGFALIDLRFVSFETKRESNGRVARGRLRLRAVTEPKTGG
jgi:hypothetical protein